MTNKLPKHINKITDPQRKAVAPYNFVELPDKIVEAEPLPDGDRYHDHKENPSHLNKIKRYTGRVKCTLTPESQIYIRCGWNPEDYAKYSESSFKDLCEVLKQTRANFFHHPADLSPIIPGSSLRGMIRNLIEIISFGKTKLVSNERFTFRAVADSKTSLGKEYRKYFLNQPQGNHNYKIKAGYMIQQGSKWKIRPAKQINQLPFDRTRISPDILTTLETWYGLNNVYKNGCEAVFIKTGQMPNKKKDFLFGLPVDNNSLDINIPDQILKEYEGQITEGQKSLTGKNGVLENMRPIFYLLSKENELIFLGHTMMFRLPYDLSPFEFVPEWLKDESKTDLAEAIFGYVDGESPRKNAHAGRVFFTDATTTTEIQDDRPIKEILLSSPKPTTFQHYLVQKDVDPKKLKHYASKPPSEEKAGETTIRGHKLYWHKEQVVDQSQDDNPETQTSLIKPINHNPDTTFTFDIHFENLSQIELGALLWVLSIGGDKAKEFGIGKAGEDYRLSLGMGKPLGMGAVKIDPTLYISDRHTRYSSLFNIDNNQWTVGESQASILQQKEYLQAFEKYVLDEKTGIAESDHPTDKRAINLKEIPRIEMLLAMLRWNSSMPKSDETSYMTITPNQYQNRPVLPTPLQIAEIPDNRRSVSESDSNPKSKSNPTPKPVPKSNSSGNIEKPITQQVEKPIKKGDKNPRKEPPSNNSGNIATERGPKPTKGK